MTVGKITPYGYPGNTIFKVMSLQQYLLLAYSYVTLHNFADNKIPAKYNGTECSRLHGKIILDGTILANYFGA